MKHASNCNPNIINITRKEDGTEIKECDCQVNKRCWDEAAKENPDNPVQALLKESNKLPHRIFKEAMLEFDKLFNNNKKKI